MYVLWQNSKVATCFVPDIVTCSRVTICRLWCWCLDQRFLTIEICDHVMKCYPMPSIKPMKVWWLAFSILCFAFLVRLRHCFVEDEQLCARQADCIQPLQSLQQSVRLYVHIVACLIWWQWSHCKHHFPWNCSVDVDVMGSRNPTGFE